MKRRVVCLVASVVLMVGSVGLEQAPVGAPMAAPVDIYAHFVGTWVGTDRYLKDGAEVTEHLRIQITEESKKRRLRLSYTYGEPGQKSTDHLTRFFTLDTLKGEMNLHWSDEPSNKYQATGLDEFARTGYGLFTVTKAIKLNGLPVISRGTFHLDADHFNYGWDESVNGKPFVVISTFKLSRETAAVAVGSPQ